MHLLYHQSISESSLVKVLETDPKISISIFGDIPTVLGFIIHDKGVYMGYPYPALPAEERKGVDEALCLLGIAGGDGSMFERSVARVQLSAPLNPYKLINPRPFCRV